MFSLLLVVTILRDRNRRRLCYHRLMLGVSVADMSASLWFALSTWPVPAGTQGAAVWEIGNETSCKVQGFFVQTAICSSFYNTSLSVYFWLIIVKGWNEQMLKRIEWLFHGIPLSWAICSAITGLIMDVYGSANLWCWVSSDEEVFRLAAFYGPLWMNILIVSLSCAAIYFHVRKIGRDSERLDAFRGAYSRQAAELAGLGRENMIAETISTTLDENHKNSTDNHEMILASFRKQPIHNHSHSPHHPKRIKEVAYQCFLYAVAFYINWLALTVRRSSSSGVVCLTLISATLDSSSRTSIQVARLIQTANGGVYFPLVLVAAITVPMQGLPNFLVYLRPRLRKVRRSNPTAGWMKRFARSIARDDNISISMARHRTSLGDGNDRFADVDDARENKGHDQETSTNEVKVLENREQNNR